MPNQPPEWFQGLAKAHDVELAHVGTMHGCDVWGCMGDCSCSFIISDNYYIDRYAYVNMNGWCQGQRCPCHDFPPTRPDAEQP